MAMTWREWMANVRQGDVYFLLNRLAHPDPGLSGQNGRHSPEWQNNLILCHFQITVGAGHITA